MTVTVIPIPQCYIKTDAILCFHCAEVIVSHAELFKQNRALALPTVIFYKDAVNFC